MERGDPPPRRHPDRPRQRRRRLGCVQPWRKDTRHQRPERQYLPVDVATGHLTATLAGPGFEGVASAAYGPQGTTLATADQNGSAYLWGRGSSRTATLPAPGASNSVYCVAFSPNGKTLATANQDGTTSLWSITAASHF